MSDKTGIEWTEATWNPVTGCSKVSQGCKNCYAERDWQRLSANAATIYYGRKFTDVQCHIDRLEQPLHWRKPRRIFVNSMGDLFHDLVHDLFIADVFATIAATPWHTYQVLTKQPQRALELLGSGCMGGFEPAIEESMALIADSDLVWPIPNLWLGVSVEDQATADERIPLLLQTPAAVRWISAEPLLGPVDLKLDHLKRYAIDGDGVKRLDWVVAGGESGPKARAPHPAWFRGLRDQCAAAKVPFFFKQWGEFHPSAEHDPLRTGCEHTPEAVNIFGAREYRPLEAFRLIGSQDPIWEGMCRIGKRAAGRLLDGVEHNGYPHA